MLHHTNGGFDISFSHTLCYYGLCSCFVLPDQVNFLPLLDCISFSLCSLKELFGKAMEVIVLAINLHSVGFLCHRAVRII